MRIEIFDLLGRRMARPADGMQPAGRHVATWEGHVDGELARSGVYLVRFQAEDRVVSWRVVLIR